MNDEEIALEVGRRAKALNEMLASAWRCGLKVEVRTLSAGARGSAMEGLRQVDVQAFRTLQTDEVTEEDRQAPAAAIRRAIGG